MREVFTGIYTIVNRANGKLYVGMTNNFFRRCNEHKYHYPKKNNVLYRAMRKYGFSRFDFILLEEVEIEEMAEREMHWIKILQPDYNMNEGGNGNLGHRLSDEMKEHLRKKAKEQWRRMTPAQREKQIKNNLTGGTEGRVVSEAMKEKLRQANLGKKQSKETILKRSRSMKKAMKGNQNGNKKVASYTLDDKKVKDYDSIVTASKEFGIHPSRITAVLKGRRNKTVGLKWKYITN